MNIEEIKRQYVAEDDWESHIICKLIDRLEKAEATLHMIDDLRNTAEVKRSKTGTDLAMGALFDTGVSVGARLAADIAREALGE